MMEPLHLPPSSSSAMETDSLAEVRTWSVEACSAMNKSHRVASLRIKKLGIEGDEHDATFEGGPDKAVLAYCSSHYAAWKMLYPHQASRFVPGSFGENFVLAHMSEKNVCIGDVVSVGGQVRLQVSLPRQPSSKLNRRFSINDFALKTWQTSRTGWYYRVLREGIVNAGDEVHLEERPWPQWTVERVQKHLLQGSQSNVQMNRQLAEMEALGEETRAQFRKSVAKSTHKADKGGAKEQWRDYRVIRRSMETAHIVSLVFESVQAHDDDDGGDEKTRAGNHVRIKLPNGMVRSYSVVAGCDEDRRDGCLSINSPFTNSPATSNNSPTKKDDGPPRPMNGASTNSPTHGPAYSPTPSPTLSSTNRFQLGIALNQNSRGGSRYLHECVHEGDVLQVSTTSNNSLNPRRAGSHHHHCFIAGGIGITGLLALLNSSQVAGLNYTLHYAVRSVADTPFRERLQPLARHTVIYDKSLGQRMDIADIVRTLPPTSQLYICGPERLMQAGRQAVGDCGIPPHQVHLEAFFAQASGDAFEVQIGRRVLRVEKDASLLHVLRRESIDVPSSCEVGNCGTCRVRIMGGRVEHRGTALLPEEKEEMMLACVSRGIGRISIELLHT